ncbi:MAG: tetratricopeptide repeat protein [Methanobacteriota archaeon]|nr:MAG: tetratricopeptide repeat protein [Euryarchaeota archaeon]
MPGKQPRVLCPVCQEPIPPDETECENCGAFVIDEAVVRLSRALGLDREKALKLFEQGFRHPTQLKDRDPDAVLEKGEVGLLFICTNCGGFVAAGDLRCSRCAAEFEPEAEEVGPAEEDILDIVLCPICGADNDSDAPECEICGEPLKEVPVPRPSPEPAKAPDAAPMEDLLARVDDFLGHVEPIPPEAAPPPPPKPAVEPAPPPRKREVTPAAPPAAPVPAPIPLKPVPVTVPRPKPKPTIRPRPAVAKPEPPTPAPVRVPDATPRPPATPALPTKQVRATLAIPRIIRRAARSRGLDLRLSPEIAGGIVLAGAASLAVSGVLRQPVAAAGVGAILLAVGAVLVLQLLRDGIRGMPLLDGLPLLAGIALQLGGASLGGDPGATAIPVGLAVASAFPLAWSTKRLAVGRWRVVLAVAGAIPLAGLALAAASGPGTAGTAPWFVGIVSAVPWPAALTISEIRRRHATSILRRELVLAERDMARRNYERSLQEYDRAIAATRVGVPGAEIPWYGKGATLILLGRYEEALRAIDMALDINPRNEVAWVNKGNALTKMGRLVDALRCFNAAIKVHPNYEVAWNNKGNALARLGKYEEALQSYERALEIDASYRGAWVNKGFVLTKLGRFDEAASCADRALHLDAGRRAEPA